MTKQLIRVGFFLPNLYLIGAQRMCATTLRYIDRGRFEPFLFVLNKEGDVADEIPSDIPIVDLSDFLALVKVPKLRLLVAPIAVAQAIKAYNLDIVVSHTPLTNLLLLSQTYINRSGPPVIIEEHQHLSTALRYDPEAFPPLFLRIYLRMLPLYNRAARLRCVSQASLEDFAGKWGVKREIMQVIPPPFDLAKMDLEATHVPDHPWFKENIPVIIGIGRLTTQKNFQFLLRVFAEVIKELPSRLIIIGEGPEYESLCRLSNELSIEKYVYLPGKIVNARAWLPPSKVFVLTSIWEGRPAVICEAMHLGVPVVSVDCPSGPSEMIEHEKSGLLTQVGDISGTAQAILSILRSTILQTRLANGGKQAAKSFDPNYLVPQFEKLMIELISSKLSK